MMLTKATALELAEHRITVNAVGPGTIDSHGRFADNPAELRAELSRIPLGRVGMPDDVAGLVCFWSATMLDISRVRSCTSTGAC